MRKSFDELRSLLVPHKFCFATYSSTSSAGQLSETGGDWFIWSISFIWFVLFNQTNQIDQINKRNDPLSRRCQ